MTSCNEIHPMTSFSFTKSISCHSLTTLMELRISCHPFPTLMELKTALAWERYVDIVLRRHCCMSMRNYQGLVGLVDSVRAKRYFLEKP